MSREFDELLRQDAERSLKSTPLINPDLSNQQWHDAEPKPRVPSAQEQGYRQNALFDLFVDRPKHISRQAQLSETIHKTSSLGSAITTITFMDYLNKLTRPTFHFDVERLILTDKEYIYAKRPLAPAIGIYGASTVANTAIDKMFFDNKQADSGTTLIDTLTPLALLTRWDPKFKLAAMILPHIATKWHAPVNAPDKPAAW